MDGKGQLCGNDLWQLHASEGPDEGWTAFSQVLHMTVLQGKKPQLCLVVSQSEDRPDASHTAGVVQVITGITLGQGYLWQVLKIHFSRAPEMQ